MTTRHLFLPLLLAVAGCVSLQPVNLAGGANRNALDQGDTVIVTVQDGTVHEFELTAIDDTGLHGPGIDIAYADIRDLNVKRIDKTKTTLTVVGVVAAIAALAGGGGSDGGGY